MVGVSFSLSNVELMNEDGTINKKSVKRKGKEIMNAISAEGGEGVEKLLKAAVDSGIVDSNAIADALKAVQSIEVGIRRRSNE